MSDIQRAFDVRQEIIAQKRDIAARFLKLGELFHDCLDQSLWKLCGSDSFNSFCADPEIGISPKTAYQYADLYKVFVLDGQVDNTRLLNIGPSNLEIIKRKYRETKDGELLDKAEHLSRGDLLEELGKPRKNKAFVSPSEKEYLEHLTPGTFEEWKKKAGCCVCGDVPVEKSHFPQTIGAGALDYMWVPMCRSCHQMLHQTGVDTFMSKYKIQIFIWVYNSMEALWEMRK
jgi:hypothetical protein